MSPAIPPSLNPRAYASHLLLAWQAELQQRRRQSRSEQLLAKIDSELARRKAEAPPKLK
jgi:hypothetical protein